MKKNNILFILLCMSSFFILLLAYSNHFYNSFNFDDAHTIVNNAFIRDIKNIPLFFEDARTFSSNPMNQTYRPMTSTTFAIDYWLGKGLASTFFFHLSTFVWYVAQCVLMYFLFMKIMNTAIQHEWNRYIALFAVSWYGLHTANAETINYICQRADSLSTLMVIAGLVIYIYLPEWRRRYLYLIPVTVGILFKASALVFAPLLFFYIMFSEKNISIPDGLKLKNFTGLVRDSLPSLLVCITMTIFVMKMASPTYSTGGGSRFFYLITQPFVILHYFIAFFLPFNLSADSDWKVITALFDERVMLGTLFIAAMFFVAYITSRKQETRPVSFGILWFFLALLPASSFVPLAEVMNDHRMFFPFVGLTLSVSWYLGLLLIKHENSIRQMFSVRLSILLIVLAVLGGHAYGTYQRNKVWHTDESLWYDVTVKSPLNGRGMMNYGSTQMKKGNYQTALEYFGKALALTPYYSYLHIHMGILKGVMGLPEEAEKYFRNALRYGAQNPEAYFYYAQWLKNQNRQNEAIPLLQHAVQLSPAHRSAQALLNEILTSQALHEQTETAVKASPAAENYINLSLQYHQEGKYQDSINACKKALEIKPDYDLAYNNICAAYNEMKMWDKAIAACEKGLKINPSLQIMKNNLARARQQKALQSKINRL